MRFSDRTFSDPLLSILVSFSALILLNFPPIFSRFIFSRLIFSPVLILTGTLLLSLLRLGATQRFKPRENKNDDGSEKEPAKNDAVPDKTNGSGSGHDPCPCFEGTFVEWNVRAPLEVIYEEYEGEEERDGSNESDPNTESEPRPVGIERYPSLSLYYPETDSDSSSDGEFPAHNMSFMWDYEEEEEKEELIEIALDEKKKVFEIQFEEENLIEIDISPMGNDEFIDAK